MSDIAALLARLDALEIRIAHQDAAIEDLNATVTAQWKSLDGALRRLALLDDRVREAEARTGAEAPGAPPPHY